MNNTEFIKNPMTEEDYNSRMGGATKVQIAPEEKHLADQTGPTLDEIERIAAVPDPALRNLQITQSYHELAQVLARRTSGYANWCTFATWASKQAGQTIRKEDLKRSLASILGSDETARLAAQEIVAAARRLGVRLHVDQILAIGVQAYDPKAALDRSSAAVGRGNLKVFAEIGREFARFYEICLEGDAYEQETVDSFCAGLRQGDPPDGQDYLREAFGHYYQALHTEEPRERLELMLLANLKIGYHEQTRLQPEINEALEAPVISPQEFARNLVAALIPEGGWRAALVRWALRTLGRLVGFDAAAEAYVQAARREVQALVTETMMTIELLPGQRVRLGDDLTSGFPAELAAVTNPDLKSLLEKIDPTLDSVSGSGAQYWGDLPDRLHFIADLFRCNATNDLLHQAPFSTQQVTAIKAGHMPEGRL